MENNFVTWEQAKLLKELGYNEECFGWYNYGRLVFFGCDLMLDGYAGEDNRPLAPLKQQAFKFFQENYYLYHNVYNYTHGEPTDEIPRGFTFSIDEDWICVVGKNEDGLFDKYYNTYVEAEFASIDKLIELASEKK